MLGDYTKAESFNKQALEILEKSLGPDHPNVAVVLENMVTLYKSMGKLEEIENLEKRVREIRLNTK